MTCIVLVTFRNVQTAPKHFTVTPYMRFDKKVQSSEQIRVRHCVSQFLAINAIGGIAAEAKMLQCHDTGRFKTL